MRCITDAGCRLPTKRIRALVVLTSCRARLLSCSPLVVLTSCRAHLLSCSPLDVISSSLRALGSMFNFNFKYANPHFGRFEESVISFSLDNFVLELLKFCGRARTTKGYLVPCGETARELFTTMGSYKKHFNSALFVDNSFVEKSFMNSQLITKAEGILDGKDVSSLSGGMREYTFDSLGHLTEQELEDEVSDCFLKKSVIRNPELSRAIH